MEQRTGLKLWISHPQWIPQNICEHPWIRAWEVQVGGEILIINRIASTLGLNIIEMITSRRLRHSPLQELQFIWKRSQEAAVNVSLPPLLMYSFKFGYRMSLFYCNRVSHCRVSVAPLIVRRPHFITHCRCRQYTTEFGGFFNMVLNCATICIRFNGPHSRAPLGLNFSPSCSLVWC